MVKWAKYYEYVLLFIHIINILDCWKNRYVYTPIKINIL